MATSATRRIYLALAPDPSVHLGALDAGEASRAPAYAVTSDVRAADPAADEEDLEYEAMCAAATDPGWTAGVRVAVAAADVPDAWVTESAGRDEAYVVALAHPITREHIVALHVQEAGADDETELLWYDVTELADLIVEFG